MIAPRSLSITDDLRNGGISYGSKSQTDGKYYDDAHPITAEGRAALTSSILKAYEQQLDQDEAQIEDQDESADEVQTM